MNHRNVWTTLSAIALLTVGGPGAKSASSAVKPTTGTTTSVATTLAPPTTTPPTTVPAPKSGGKAIIGVQGPGAGSSGWLPADGTWADGEGMISGAVFDRMMLVGADGTPVPNLLTSATPSSDFKTWTLTVRSGITFHNGEALDGAAIAANLEADRTGSVLGQLLANLIGCTSSGQTVVCAMRTPWVNFPLILTSAVGATAAPSQLKAKDRLHPIGTGPFVCKGECWTPGVSMKLVKNPNYWRKGLPKLDEVEFRPLSFQTATDQMRAGQLQFREHTFFLGPIYLAAIKKANITLTTMPGATAYDVVNMAKKDNPLLDLRLRRAWAYAIDLDALTKTRTFGAAPGIPANGPFPKGVDGYLEDSGYPKYDLAKAKALVDEYKKERGVTSIPVTYGGIDASAVAAVKSMVDQAGFDVKPILDESVAQGAMFTGAFDVVGTVWLPFAEPDAYRSFLASEGCGGPQVCPFTLGRLTLNWGRVVDQIVDTMFDQIRSNSDPVVRKHAAESITRVYGDQVYAFWRWRTPFEIESCATCAGVIDAAGPNGEALANPASHYLGVAWLTVG